MLYLILFYIIALWFSGRILACQAGDRGSIPRQCNDVKFQYFWKHINTSDFVRQISSAIYETCPTRFRYLLVSFWLTRVVLSKRGHPGLNQRPLDLQSNALLLSYIPMPLSNVHSWLLYCHLKRIIIIMLYLILFYFIALWFSGRILACHAGDRGSIPRQCNDVKFQCFWKHINTSDLVRQISSGIYETCSTAFRYLLAPFWLMRAVLSKGHIRVWTRDLSICSRMLYHWDISHASF